MATYTAATYDFTLSVDANYRTLWGDVDTKLRTLGGWTYVSQTGDSDPSAATAGANDTYPSWRVYSTTVSGETWYMRLDFGHGANGPSYKVQFGSSVNGSGTLGGQLSTQQTCKFGGSVTGASKTIYIAQATGRFMMLLGIASGTLNAINAVSVCGGVDNTGAMSTGLDLFIQHNDGATDFVCQRVPVSGTVPAQVSKWWPNIANLADQTVGGVVLSGHPFLWDTSGGVNPSPAVAVGGTSNSTAGNSTTLTLYGGSHTYIAVGTTSPNGALTNLRALFLYE